MRLECVSERMFMCTDVPLLLSRSHILFVSIETRVQIQESVRGKDVFVIQTVSKYERTHKIKIFIPYNHSTVLLTRLTFLTLFVHFSLSLSPLSHSFSHHLSQPPTHLFSSPILYLCLSFPLSNYIRDVNTTIMEMLIMVYACKTSCARSITGVLPYFPYSKQCKMRKRGSIVSKLIASMMCKAGK